MKNLLVYFIVVLFTIISNAQSLRTPRDSVGFCWNSNEFDRFISFLDSLNNGTPDSVTENIVAAISPHDDYLYAGNIYYPLYKLIKAKEIVVFGVTHGTVRRAMNDPQNIIILDRFKHWFAPYGNVEISPLRDIIKRELNKNYYMISNKAQSIEHSIEAVIPFLQHYNRKIKLTPIMVTKMPFERADSISSELSRIIIEYIKTNHYKLGKDIFFLISNDANHYGKDFDNSPFGLDEKAHAVATAKDREIISKNLNGEINKSTIYKLANDIWESLNPQAPLWCGRYPIVFGLLTTDKIVNQLYDKALQGKLLRYSDTFTEGVLPFKNTQMGTTAPVSYEHWVGFFSEIFYIRK